MADQYHVFVSSVPYANAPLSLIDVAQDPSGTSVVRVYRLWHFDSLSHTVSGQLTVFTVARTLIAGVQRSNVTVVPVKSTSVLPVAVTAGSHRAPIHSSIFRQYARDTTQWTLGTDNINIWEFDVPMALVWDAGYADANVSPIVCRAGYGVHIRLESPAPADFYTSDFEAEFTVGST